MGSSAARRGRAVLARAAPTSARPAARGPRRTAALVLALLAISATSFVGASPAAAQGSPTPVLVEDLDETYSPRIDTGTDPVEFRWRLYNIDSNTRYFIRISVPPVPGWAETVAPNQFFIEPLTGSNVTLTLVPAGRVPERVAFTVTFSLVDSDTGNAYQVAREVDLIASESVLVLGVFDNPLPPPLDDAYGVFLLDVAFWAVFGLIAVFAGDAFFRTIAARMHHETLRKVLTKLRRALFLLVVAIGIERSFRILPVSDSIAAVSTVLRILVVVLWAVVAYRVIGAALEYYSSVLAGRTETKIDDVLVPVLRKVAAVIVIVVALAFVMELFGFSLNLVFGAAGIAGLVIAFAAQDTLSNFFSGIFLLIDRPFLEGDDVQVETGEVCRVEHIGLRSTRLYHYRNHETIVLPNNQLASRKVVTLTAPDRRFRMFVNIGVAYGSEVAKVKAALDRAARANPGVVAEPGNEPFVMIEKFGESSIDFLLIFLVTDVKERGRIASEVREGILAIFEKEGIVIPFPHRTLIVQGDLPPGRA